MGKRAAFLDRDGTLIVDYGYVHDPSQVKLMPGVIEALLKIKELGFVLIIISNQSGVGRGFFTKKEVDAVNDYLKSLLGVHDITLDDIYCCPHGPEEGCACRKPKPGLVLQAIEEHEIDAQKSYFVGDKWTDVQTAIAAGVKPVLISDDYRFPIDDAPVLIVDSLLTWTKLIDKEDL